MANTLPRYVDPIETQDVRMLDPMAVGDPYGQKAILSMQTKAAVIDGAQNANELNAKLHDISAEIGVSPALTYEDLIFANPVFNTVRVLSQDELIAPHEARFYRAHRVIERCLHAAIVDLTSYGDNAKVIEPVETFDPNFDPDVEDFSATPEQLIKTATHRHNGLRQGLSKEVFYAFRDFFMDGLNGYHGPSGLYSATIPILDLVANGGVNIKNSIREFMHAAIDNGLYPNRGGHSDVLKHLLELEDPRFDMPDSTRIQIIKGMNSFRRAHDTTVRKVLPDVYDDKLRGSGGIEKYSELSAAKKVDPGQLNAKD